nr:hypothetical protein [Tanacetum cinerariifolium]
MNYQPVTAGYHANPSTGFQDKFDAEKAGEEIDQQYVLFLVWSSGFTNPQNNDEDAAFDGKNHDFDEKKPESEVNVSLSISAQSRKQDDKTKKEAKGKSPVESFIGYRYLSAEFKDCYDNSINEVNAAGFIVPTVGQNSSNSTNTFSADEADFNNLKTSIMFSPIPTTRVHKDHPVSQIIMICLQLLKQEKKPKRVHQALKDPSWIEAMQEELLQFKMQKVWVLVDLPHGKRAINTKWVYKNKKDKRGIMIRNKARLVAQGHTQEEGIDYEEVFAPVARIEVIRLFLAYASFIGFMVYQKYVKSAFLYATIEEEVYVYQPPRFEDPDYFDKVYKVVKALYGLHQAPRAWYETLANYVLENDDIIFGATNKDLCKSFENQMKDKFQMSSMRELTFFLGLQVKQKKDGIFISQDKYIAEILRKFGLTEGKSASTSIDTEKPLLKDPDGEDVDVHTYKSMIGSLMYLTTSRLDIMFAVCACVCFQVTLKASHLQAVKRVFRYLKGNPHLGLWHPKDSPFDLVAYSDSDYAGCSKWNGVFEKNVTCFKNHKCWLPHHTTNGSQFTMSNPHKNWLVQIKRSLSWLFQKQTALGKDTINPLTVDSLLKTIWSSIHHLLINEALTIPGQTTTGKEISNPFMAGGVNTPRSDEDRLELMELMVFLLPWLNKLELELMLLTYKFLLMVAYLSKYDASEGFNQILDFLNRSSIKYALTVNPNIYVSCIKQFWNTVVVKQVNDVTRLQALVDKKKVVVIEAAIREVLRLDDAEGVDCLPNEEIFIELARIGYEKPSTKLTFYKAFFLSQWKFLIHTILQCMSAKRTSWNEFSSLMTSHVICLSTSRKFNFSKYIFDSLEKGFLGVKTPFFKGILVDQEADEEGDADEHVKEVIAGVDAHGDDSAAHGEVPTVQPPSPQTQHQHPPQLQQAVNFPTSLLQEAIDAYATLTKRVKHLEYDKVAQALEITKLKRRVRKLEKRNKVRVLKLRRLQRVGTSQRVDTSDDTMMDDESNQGRMIAEMDKDDVVVLMDDKEEDKKVEEAKVNESAQDQGRQAESQAEIYNIDMDHANKVLSMQEDEILTATLTVGPTRVAAAPSKRRKGLVIRDPELESATSTIIPAETKSKDEGKWIMVEEPKPLKKKQQIEMAEQYARELHADLNKDIDWDEAIDHVKRKAKEDPTVKRYQVLKRMSQTKAQARKNMIMYLKNVVGFKIDYFKGMSYDNIRPIFEAKFNLNVAFLLKTKEQIEEEENRALQKINETPAERAAKRRKLDEKVKELKRHLKIVPNEDDDERFSTAKPKNFFDDFLRTTLGAMFKTPDVHAQIWKNQRSAHGQAKVKSWKLLESCGV